MQLNIKHITLLLSLCAAFAACSEQDVFIENNPDGKTPIELSSRKANSQTPTTRAVVIDGQGKITAFEKDTRLHMLMISQKGSTSDTKWTVTYGLAQGCGKAPAGLTDGENSSPISFDDTRRCSQTYTDPANELDPAQRSATDNNSYEGSWRYWDDAFARDAKVSVYGMCIANTVLPFGAPWNQKINGVKSNAIPAWTDDASSVDFVIGREDGSGNRISWTIGKHDSFTSQSFHSVLYKDDICYSNNIADYNGKGGTDDRMWFNHNVAGKFDTGNLVFHRAMSLITIKLYHGKGFDKNSTANFLFDTNKNIMMKGFNKSGLLNIQTGVWDNITSGDWQTICNTDPTPVTGGTNPAYTLLAFTIPGNDLKAAVDANNPADALTISIDGNEYKVSKKDLYDAIAANGANCEEGTPNGTVKSDYLTDGTKLKAGINYEFSFIIGKKEIDAITAQIVDWETVTAVEQHPTNARINLDVEDRSGSSSTSPVTSNMDIYRALDEAPSITDTYEGYNWTTGYNTDGKAKWNDATLEYNSGENCWSTDWYWESNKHYYHFRTLSPTTQAVTANAGGDYTTITSSSCADAEHYNQMSWGAPFLDVDPSYKFTYSTTKGFDGTGSGHQIYKAIGPTKDQIKVLMFHMFSGVHFTIKTTGSAVANTDKVELFDGTNRTKVDLVGYYPDGKVLLGTGLVNADGTISTEGSPCNISFASAANDTHYANQEYFFSAIPQDLTNVLLVITTPDHNQYKVKLWDEDHPITATVTNNNLAIPYDESSTDGKYIINRWYPGFKYNYSFTLAKTGITNLQATIVDWETVEADNETVQIK